MWVYECFFLFLNKQKRTKNLQAKKKVLQENFLSIHENFHLKIRVISLKRDTWSCLRKFWTISASPFLRVKSKILNLDFKCLVLGILPYFQDFLLMQIFRVWVEKCRTLKRQNWKCWNVETYELIKSQILKSFSLIFISRNFKFYHQT